MKGGREAPPLAGLAAGDRILYLGIGPRGQHADLLSVRGHLSSARFKSGAMWVLTRDCHAIPRRPDPDF